jgi:hypothetical protein
MSPGCFGSGSDPHRLILAYAENPVDRYRSKAAETLTLVPVDLPMHKTVDFCMDTLPP